MDVYANSSHEILTETRTMELKAVQYLSKRRNTERIPEELNPFRCRQNNHSNSNKILPQKAQQDGDCLCTKRRHTLAPNVSQLEFFEKETKLIVLEFLQNSTPQFKLNRKTTPKTSSITSIQETEVKQEFVVGEQRTDAAPNVTKRPVKKERKVSKAKTVTLGEKDRLDINAELEKKERSGKRFKRSSSDLTAQKYQLMKRTFHQMQLPLIQWLKEHEPPVDDGDNNDNNDGDNKADNTVVLEEEIVPVNFIEVESEPIREILLTQGQSSDHETTKT